LFFSLALPFLAKYIAPIAIGIAGIGIAIFLRSLARRSWLGMFAGGLVGVAASAVGYFTAVYAVTFWYWQSSSPGITPDQAFLRAFGMNRSAEVTQIRSRISVLIRTQRQLLRFHAPPRTIAGSTHPTRPGCCTTRPRERGTSMTENPSMVMAVDPLDEGKSVIEGGRGLKP